MMLTHRLGRSLGARFPVPRVRCPGPWPLPRGPGPVPRPQATGPGSGLGRAGPGPGPQLRCQIISLNRSKDSSRGSAFGGPPQRPRGLTPRPPSGAPPPPSARRRRAGGQKGGEGLDEEVEPEALFNRGARGPGLGPQAGARGSGPGLRSITPPTPLLPPLLTPNQPSDLRTRIGPTSPPRPSNTSAQKRTRGPRPSPDPPLRT